MEERKSVYSDVGNDAAFLRRRLSLLGKVLPIPVRLEADEHLRDGIFRAVHENGRKDTSVAGKLAESRTFRRLSAFKSIADGSEIERLLDVLGLSSRAVNVIGAIAKPTSISRSHISFFGHDIPKNHLTTLRRVSPLALQRRSYLRALWSIAPFSFDIETKERLLDHCPKCGADLDWLKTNGIANCGHCSFDLRASPPQPIVSTFDDEAMAYVTGTINPLVSNECFRSFQSRISDVANRGEQFQLAVRVAGLYQRSYGSDAALGQIAPYSLARAGRALLRWPNGIAELADEISSATETPIKDTVLSRLQYDQNFSCAIRSKIKAVFDQSERIHILKKRLNQRSLGFGEPVVDVVRDIKSLRNMSGRLGLPVPDVLELFLAGYLTELRGDLLALGFDHECQPKAGSVDPMIVGSAMEKQELSIASVRFAVDTDLQVRWSTVLAAISAGELHVYRDNSGHGLVRDLRTTSYSQMLSLVGTSQGSRFRHVTLTQTEVGMVLGCKTSLGAAVIRSGMIAGCPTIQKLADFRRDHAFTFELRHLAHINCLPVSHLSRSLIEAGVECRDFGATKVWRRTEACDCLGIQ